MWPCIELNELHGRICHLSECKWTLFWSGCFWCVYVLVFQNVILKHSFREWFRLAAKTERCLIGACFWSETQSLDKLCSPTQASQTNAATDWILGLQNHPSPPAVFWTATPVTLALERFFGRCWKERYSSCARLRLLRCLSTQTTRASWPQRTRQLGGQQSFCPTCFRSSAVVHRGSCSPYERAFLVSPLNTVASVVRLEDCVCGYFALWFRSILTCTCRKWKKNE